tara:strand:+ start:617 stop:856 length:240 start_codon:yes stop_codon:yes gene_type:complete
MENNIFFKAVNEAFEYEYVKNPGDYSLVKTRDSIESFLAHQTLIEKHETSLGSIWSFEGRGARALMVMVDGDFCFCWED